MITVLAARNSLARELKLMTFYLGTFLLCGRENNYVHIDLWRNTLLT
jgi:hypothetical protein